LFNPAPAHTDITLHTYILYLQKGISVYFIFFSKAPALSFLFFVFWRKTKERGEEEGGGKDEGKREHEPTGIRERRQGMS
jgi:hypothetical protein